MPPAGASSLHFESTKRLQAGTLLVFPVLLAELGSGRGPRVGVLGDWTGFGVCQSWASFLVLPQNTCVTLGMGLDLFEEMK